MGPLARAKPSTGNQDFVAECNAYETNIKKRGVRASSSSSAASSRTITSPPISRVSLIKPHQPSSTLYASLTPPRRLLARLAQKTLTSDTSLANARFLDSDVAAPAHDTHHRRANPLHDIPFTPTDLNLPQMLMPLPRLNMHAPPCRSCARPSPTAPLRSHRPLNAPHSTTRPDRAVSSQNAADLRRKSVIIAPASENAPAPERRVALDDPPVRHHIAFSLTKKPHIIFSLHLVSALSA